MEEILSNMNFDPGMAIPVANVENKKLEQQLEKNRKDTGRLREEIDQYMERVRAMSDHLKNVRQERQQTQELCNAREREIKTEEHSCQLAEREEGRLRIEIQRLEKELDGIKERKNIYENNIFKNTERIESMKGQMNWDQQSLNAWLKESAKRDEDAMILQKYAKVDEGKIKELSLRQENLVDDSSKRRKALEHEITQTLTTQLELDKVSEAFRDAHQTRQDLLRQWETTIQQMQRRDNEIDETSLKLMELRFELRKAQEDIKEKQQFLDSELNNNKEKEKKISAAERNGAKLRLEYQNAENTRVQFQDELETLKYKVDRTGKDSDNVRKHATEVKKEVDVKKDRLQNLKDIKLDLDIQLQRATDSKMTTEERALILEKALKKEEQNIVEVERELSRFREIQFKKTQELYQARQTESNTTAEIQGEKAASRNLSSKLYKLDQESLKQQEIVYNQDFQLQQLERRITRLQGERTNEEKIVLEDKIKQLTHVLEAHQNKRTVLATQLKKLGDDLRRASRDLTKGSEEKESLDNKIGELTLHNDNSERELRSVRDRKEDLMVDENLLKLELKRARDRLVNRATEVLSLEDRRLLLETAMKERREEIGIHTVMLRGQVKSAEEERQKISSELHQRISKIERLRKRYEILMVTMAPPEGEEEKSQTYYVIKAAQEKEELQRTGDTLDAKIRKAEKEIRALENTLQLMTDRNETCRKTFSSVEETSEEYEQKMQLEEQLRAVMDKCKYKKRQLNELREDLQTMEETSESLIAEENELLVVMEEKQRTIESLQKELDLQEEKKDRANKVVSKIARELKKSSKKDLLSEDEDDIKVRELRDFNNSLMKKFGVVCRDHPDMTPIVHLYFQQAGLPNPPSPGPGSSRPSSVGSSRRASSIISARSIGSLGSGDGSVRSCDGSVRSSVGSVRSSVGSVRSSVSQRQALSTTSVDLGSNVFASHQPIGTPPRSATSSRASSGKSTPVRASSGKSTPTRASSGKSTPARASSGKSTPTRASSTGERSPTKSKTPTSASKSGSRPPTGRSSAGSSRQ